MLNPPFAGMFRCDAAVFDGTNDYMTRGAALTGVSDGKLGTLSLWVKVNGADGAVQYTIVMTTSTPSLKWRTRREPTTNVWSVLAINSAGSTIFDIRTTATVLAGTGWHNILSSWDLSVPTSHLYLDDVSDQNVVTRTNDTIPYATSIADVTICAQLNSGSFKANEELAEVYLDTTTYIDLSVVANRRKFISASKRPVFLGVDGRNPTGSPPAIYFRLAKGESASNFATNRGSGGNFTITGALTTGATSPSL